MPANIVLVQPDPFSSISQKIADYIPNLGKAQDQSALKASSDKDKFHLADTRKVSRPVRGFSAKPDSFAYVQVIDGDGNVIKVFNRLEGDVADTPGNPVHNADEKHIEPKTAEERGKPQSYVWTDWILQGVREERMEKTQVVETFGETYIYAFGEKPRSLVFTGLLMNTKDYNWKAVFWENWDKYFRASKLVSLNARLYIGYDDVIVEGYPINAVANHTADSPNALSFSFNFLVTNYINIEANQGFKNALSHSPGSVQAGYQTGVARLGPGRMSLMNLLGIPNSAQLGRALYDTLLDKPGVSQSAAALAGKSLTVVSAAAAHLTHQAIMGEANTRSFTQALRAHTARTFVETSRAAVRNYEMEHNLVRGEVNAWFGKMTGVLQRGMDVTHLDDSEAISNVFYSGTFDEILRKMSYNINNHDFSKTTDEIVKGPDKVSPQAKPKPGAISVVPRPGR